MYLIVVKYVRVRMVSENRWIAAWLLHSWRISLHILLHLLFARFSILFLTIVVIDLYIQIKHEYHDNLRIDSFNGDHWKDIHFCGIVANRIHLKHSLSTSKGIISNIHSNMWSELTRTRKPFSLKYVQNRWNLIN